MSSKYEFWMSESSSGRDARSSHLLNSKKADKRVPLFHDEEGADSWEDETPAPVTGTCSVCDRDLRERTRFECFDCKGVYRHCVECEKLQDAKWAGGLPLLHDRKHVFVKLRPGQSLV